MRLAVAIIAAALLAPALAAAQPAASSAERGEAVYQDRCVMCHQLEGIGQGPNLKGVVGRKAGSVPDFPYTDALKGSGVSWTTDRLDIFLQGPMQMIPGTAMPMIVPEAPARADLIAYLATLKP